MVLRGAQGEVVREVAPRVHMIPAGLFLEVVFWEDDVVVAFGSVVGGDELRRPDRVPIASVEPDVLGPVRPGAILHHLHLLRGFAAPVVFVCAPEVAPEKMENPAISPQAIHRQN